MRFEELTEYVKGSFRKCFVENKVSEAQIIGDVTVQIVGNYRSYNCELPVLGQCTALELIKE